MQTRWSNQMQQSTNYPVVQNKENKMSGALFCKEPALQNQSWRQTCHFDHEPQRHLGQDTFPQSARHIRFDNGFPDSHQDRLESSQIDGAQMNQNHKTTPSGNQNQYFYGHQQRDFTSDIPPENGALVFKRSQVDRTAPKPADRLVSENKMAPMQDVEVGTMLKQIRRALGVREPCRAEREARRQSCEACAHATGTAKQVEASGNSIKSPPAAPSSAGVTTNQKPKLSITVSNSGKEDSRSTGLSESDTGSSRKVRIAHKSNGINGEEETASKPDLDKSFTPTGANNKQNLRQVYKENKKSERTP
ncbi:hypothetical protein OJAV_G00228990, partial [Oryzias javanicus]